MGPVLEFPAQLVCLLGKSNVPDLSLANRHPTGKTPPIPPPANRAITMNDKNVFVI
jgi:hypothetical protein